MALQEASEELKKLETAQQLKYNLDTRMDTEFAIYRGDAEQYDIPKSEGEWERVITNRALVESNRVMDDLSYAARKLWIPVADEDHRDRAALSATEKTAIGLIYLADQINGDAPMSADIQSLLVAYRMLRGWSAVRFVLREEDGKLIPDIAVWDPRNVYWNEGKKRIAWCANVRYSTKSQVESEYKGWNGKADDNGLVTVYDVWDCSDGKAEEGVIIDGEYVKTPQKVKVGSYTLGYIPIRIKAGKALSLIAPYNSNTTNQNIEYVGQSYISNNKNLFSLESRLLSYQMTRAGELAKAPLIVEWDSTKEALPPAFEKDPSVKGRVVYLDISKGQRVAEKLTPPSGQEIMEIYNSVLGLLGIGGMNAVAFGRINQTLPAQGIDILSHAALANEMPYKKGVEEDFEWLAGEVVRQYKNGDFGDYEFEGYDKSNNSFYAKVKPKDINENWHFACQLVPDLLRDKIQMINAAAMAIKSGILSKSTAREDFQIVLDPDAEEKKVDREEAKAITGPVESLLAMVEDYASSIRKGKVDPSVPFLLTYAYQKLNQITQPPQPMGQMPQMQPGNQRVAQNQNGIAPPSVPQPVAEAAQQNGGV
jgi:hypothetical protein